MSFHSSIVSPPEAGRLGYLGPLGTPVNAGGVVRGRRAISGSFIGGVPETQQMLDFCGKHGIVSDVEVIAIQQIDEAYERLLKSDVKYRFVIDMASLKHSGAAA